ncbi:hypothetical protein [Vibrio coralliilyticus]|uniref:hypothetical protein n=1 Tax=Vibrio coralliilyticus TaxID=190893 RepID=UPI00180628C2|nr:hypothetical protein [Vibrio coralliilyticus]NUW70138.1 hypothetical protein [Vibrio coralliilyticus]
MDKEQAYIFVEAIFNMKPDNNYLNAEINLKTLLAIAVVLYSPWASSKTDVDILDINKIKSSVSAEIENNNVIFGVGNGLHSTEGGEATGMYLSGVYPIGNTGFGVYGRVEYISDEYKTGQFQAFNVAAGAAWYLSSDIVSYISYGKCISSYLTCYFNDRNASDEPASEDWEAHYIGLGTYVDIPGEVIPGMFEFAFDYSPYKGFGAKSFYIGYGVQF